MVETIGLHGQKCTFPDVDLSYFQSQTRGENKSFKFDSVVSTLK